MLGQALTGKTLGLVGFGRIAQATAARAAAFGMHILHFGSYPWPNLPIGSVRLWDNDVRWADLQPSGPAWDPAALKRWLNT